MKIKEFSIDRYGVWSKLHLDELEDGLNVVFGAAETTTTTIIQFLQAMLYGFSHERESASLHDSFPWGGSLVVDGPYGRCAIRRHDDGTRTGRLSLHWPDGAPVHRQMLSDLLCGVEESAFRRIFSASFREAPATGALVQTAATLGFDITEAPGERLERRGKTVDHDREIALLTDRRRAAEMEAVDIEREREQLDQRRHEDHRRTAEEIERCQAELLHWRRELQSLDDEIAARAASGGEHLAEGASLRDRIQAVRSQMARWRKVRHDVLRRRTRLRREMLSWTGEGSHPLAAHWGDAQKHIDSIERRLDQLQREIELLSPPAAGESRNGRETSQHCGPLASAIRDEVYQLCRELSRHYLQQRREAVTDELRQLGRCHAVVVWRLQRLAKLRRRLEHELQAEHALLAPVRGRRHEAADQLRRCENQLRTLNDQRRARDRRSPAEQASRWETRLRELEAIQREIDRRLERLTVRPLDPLRVEEYSSPVESKAMHEASEFLRRLTDGQYVRIHVWRHDRTLRIEDVEGELFSLDASAPASQSIHATPLGPSVRDRVHLALCLALVEAYARRGVHLPLLLADPFRHLNAGQAERLGEVLRDYSARGRQVLVFTDQEQTARVFRRMNIAVRELPLTGDFHHHRVSRWENEPVRIRTGAAALASLEGRPALAARVVEVFTPGSNSHSGTEAHFRRSYLRRSDALEYAPDVDSAAARELTYQGIANVGEFLALSPAAVEQRLSHLRVTAETIRRWQAIARLMCDTPNLRAYDARILAASGVASADELERLAPEELLERVSRCLETDQGRSLFRQGDDDELARLASWVGSGRTTQTLRETQKRHGMKQSA